MERRDRAGLLGKQARELVDPAAGLVGNLANFTALLFETLEDLNWVGFYLFDGQKLVLGPFQGRVACTVIPLDRGICGASFRQKSLKNIPDVHAEADHIACDSRSRSELVIPLAGDPQGVLDIDSPKKNRFDALTVGAVQEALEAFWGALPQDQWNRSAPI